LIKGFEPSGGGALFMLRGAPHVGKGPHFMGLPGVSGDSQCDNLMSIIAAGQFLPENRRF
jgi:hypothetical protein